MGEFVRVHHDGTLEDLDQVAEGVVCVDQGLDEGSRWEGWEYTGLEGAAQGDFDVV